MNGYLLVTNASAGTHADHDVEAARAVLDASAPVRTVETGSPEDLQDALRDADGRTIVVAGGDGSLHAVVNALHRIGTLPTTPVGLVPLGTGNDFARGVDIPLDPVEAARVVAGTDPVHVDVLLDSTGTIAVNNAHLGIGAEASRAGSGWKQHLGKAGYAVGALWAGLRPHYVRVRVEIDGRVVHDGRVAQVAVGNAPNVGGGAELVPGADPTAGRATVIVFDAVGLAGRILYAARLRRGEHHRMREVTRLSGDDVTVAGQPFWVTTDGELSGPHRAMQWRLLPGAMLMHLPAPLPM